MTRRKDAPPETPQPESPQTEPPHTGPFVAEVDSAAPDVAETVPQREPLMPSAPPPARANRPGIFAPLLGGALAAIGGFALSHFNVLGFEPSNSPVDLGPLTQQIQDAAANETAARDKISGDIASLADRMTALEAAPTANLSRLDDLDQRLAAIEKMPKDGSASSAALTAKITELEQRIASLPSGGSDPALKQKLDDALARLGEAENAAATRAAEAEAAAAKAARDTALDTLSDTIVAGQPYLSELQALADPTLSEALGAMAESGVPTLASLQEGFPEAARQALRTARDLSSEDGWSDRLVDFLAAQTGARPLTPLEGDAPDAILSRAEFALSEGRVDDALTELAPLDPAVKAPLEPWIVQAKAHVDATAALQAARGE